MKDSRKRATLKDVAKEAGVSVSAVSTVMNGNKYGISPLTAEKILAAASSLGYAPNTAARALKTNSSKTIGVITASHYHSYHTDILIGINEAAVQAGYVVITHYTNRTAESERSGMEFMLKHNVDGLIFISPSDTSIRALTHIKNSGIPSVFIERLAQINGNDVISSVLSDNAGGGYNSMKHLLDGGERNIYIFCKQQNEPASLRLGGALSALDEYGIDISADRIIDIDDPENSDPSKVFKRLLESGVRDAAIWCSSNGISLRIMDAITKSEFSIPEDFRLISYDATDNIDYLRYPFSTMEAPKTDIGMDAAKLLIGHIEGRINAPEHRVHKPTLKKRMSTR